MGVATQSAGEFSDDMPQWQRDALLGGAGYGESTSSGPGQLPYPPQSGVSSQYPQGGLVTRPSFTKVVLNHKQDGLEIEIPPVGFTIATLAMTAFTIVWNFFVWSAEIGVSRPQRRVVSLLFMVPFMVAGLWLVWECARMVMMRTRVFVGPTNYYVEWSMGSRVIKTKGGHTGGITIVRMLTSKQRHVFGSADDSQYDFHDTTITETKSTSVEICEGRHSHKFGESLKAVENDWLAREISAFLGHLQPSNPPPQESTTFFGSQEKGGMPESQGGYSYGGSSAQSTYGTAPIPPTWN